MTTTDHTPVATHDLGNGIEWVSYRDGGIVVTLPGRGVSTLASIDELTDRPDTVADALAAARVGYVANRAGWVG